MLIPWRVSTLISLKNLCAPGEVQETANGDHRGHGSLGELGEEDVFFFQMEENRKNYSNLGVNSIVYPTHMLHVWYVYLHENHKNQPNVDR